MGLSDTC